VAQRVEDAVLAVTERTASEVALARQAEAQARTAVDAATREVEGLRAELARLRAQQAARDAHHRKQMEQEAALWAAELRHMEAIGFDVSHYNIAVAGPAGTGKSTFINSMRGLLSDDPGAATVGTGAQTTTESARFPMPGADHIVFWDEPGGDTLDFPAATYFERRCLRHFDCIIAMYNGRFTAVMSAIVHEALKRCVPVLIVYTKMSVDVRNEQGNRRVRVSAADAEAALRKRVRGNIVDELRKLRVAADPSEVSNSASAVPLFFVDSVLMVQGKWRFDEKALKLEVVRCFAPRLGGAMTAEELWAHVAAIAGEDAAEWQVPREE
jgi:energy-coupling factor transporter ATP-binding protein EcfA2